MWNLVWLKHTLSETKNLVCKFFVDSRYWYAEYSLIGGLFTNDFVCRFGRYMRGITAWASTAFGQGELLVAGGKLQRRTVARGSHGVHQSLRQFGVVCQLHKILVC